MIKHLDSKKMINFFDNEKKELKRRTTKFDRDR